MLREVLQRAQTFLLNTSSIPPPSDTVDVLTRENARLANELRVKEEYITHLLASLETAATVLEDIGTRGTAAELTASSLRDVVADIREAGR